MAELWTIKRVLAWTSDFFRRQEIDAPRLTAEILLAHVLACDRVRLYMDLDRPLQQDELSAYRGLVERRKTGEPTAYILGKKEFLGRKFSVDPRVLIPRPETEQLVETALERIPESSNPSILDLCTGSGCIAISIAAERNANLVATDSSEQALELAKQNASDLGVAPRITFLLGDLFEPVSDRSFSMIISNPPYVATATIDQLSKEVKREPRNALDGGADGLAILKKIASRAIPRLEAGGWLLLEIGENQGNSVLEMLRSAGFTDYAIHRDFAGLERIAVARRP